MAKRPIERMLTQLRHSLSTSPPRHHPKISTFAPRQPLLSLLRLHPSHISSFAPRQPPLSLSHPFPFLKPLSTASDSSRSKSSGASQPLPRSKLPVIGPLVNGWRSRVAADPEFAFKVLMEQLIGVTASVAGDMASRPNFGLNELDFVFSSIVVCSIVNFALMYLLAPAAGGPSSSPSPPPLFPGSPRGHMFEPGAFTLANRLGTLALKGAAFATVGFGAGLVGTAITNGLVAMRRRMDPGFEPPNEPPPTLLNAATWAVQMGLSSNLRYQMLNGAEYVLAKRLPAAAFKASVVSLRTVNNVVGGMSFVMFARLTGSQKAPTPEAEERGGAEF